MQTSCEKYNLYDHQKLAVRFIAFMLIQSRNIRVDVLEEFALQEADGVCICCLNKHRVLVNQPRVTYDISR